MSKRKRSEDEAKAAVAKAAAAEATEDSVEEAEEAMEEENSGSAGAAQLMSTAELNQANTRMKCPYLDTINKQLVDFDSEKLCSVTLSNMNVYACLVCGKFFSGRGKATPAYTHSVHCGHFVFMNLHSARTYCLPDSYEVLDSSLDLIVKSLIPRYTMEKRLRLNSNTSLARDVYGISYLPGFIGLNNLNSTDYVNVVLHALAHITPFRDFWLELEHYKFSKSNLVHHFGSVMRKMWSSHNFKSTVSPMELMQEISVESKKMFSIGSRSQCMDILMWLLAKLHKGIYGTSKPSATSVVYEPFQGIIEVTSMTKMLTSSAHEVGTADVPTSEWVESVVEMPFTHLSLDIPPCPLFRDSHGGLVIPQIPLFQLLEKFDGETWTDTVSSEAHTRKKYRIKKLPRYLILHLMRFTKNNFTLEKNPTIVTFPVKNLEMRSYLSTSPDADKSSDKASTTANGAVTASSLEMMSAAQLTSFIDKKGSELQRRDAALCSSSTASFPSSSSSGHSGSNRNSSSTGSSSGSSSSSNSSSSSSSSNSSSSSSSSSSRSNSSSSNNDNNNNSTNNTSTNNTSTNNTSTNNSNNTKGPEAVLAQLRAIAARVLARQQDLAATKYDLVANICHDSTEKSQTVTVGDVNFGVQGSQTQTKKKKNPAGLGGGGAAGPTAAAQVTSNAVTSSSVLNAGAFKVHVKNKATTQWYEISDLRVSETMPQLIGISESNMLIYEVKPADPPRPPAPAFDAPVSVDMYAD